MEIINLKTKNPSYTLVKYMTAIDILTILFLMMYTWLVYNVIEAPLVVVILKGNNIEYCSNNLIIYNV